MSLTTDNQKPRPKTDERPAPPPPPPKPHKASDVKATIDVGALERFIRAIATQETAPLYMNYAGPKPYEAEVIDAREQMKAVHSPQTGTATFGSHAFVVNVWETKKSAGSGKLYGPVYAEDAAEAESIVRSRTRRADKYTIRAEKTWPLP